jgi:hypothetical protein
MIINGFLEFEKLTSRMTREPHVYVPVMRDIHYHRIENQILCVGITFQSNETFVVSVTHDDSTTFPIEPTPFSKNHLYLLASLYERGHELPSLQKEYTSYIASTHSVLGNFVDINKTVPLTVWNDVLIRYSTQLTHLLNDQPTFTENIIRVLQMIEDNGLYVDREKLAARFDKKILRSFKGNFVYSEYNVFTTTGRPSNRFGGINFSALNKSDDTREMFISRYTDGVLVQMDFEAYHLRLIANHLGISLPETSVHTELAKIYFNTDNITDEMYDQSKKKTFNLLYGIVDNDYSIELFDKIYEFRKQFENSSLVTLPSGITVSVDDPNSSKLFNYYMQSLEIVKTIPKLEKVLSFLNNTDSKLVLYTYDSILLDMKTPNLDIISGVKAILEEGNFPVRTTHGKNYKNISLSI